MTLAVLTSVVAFAVAISVLVAVHEFGHFWMARRLGFKVLRFSIGFGRPLLTRLGAAPDRTEYVLAAVPLGGYVKMLDEREGPLSEADRERAFQHRPPLSRIAVLLAGPTFNFLFAIVAFWLLFMHGVPGLKPVIGNVTPGSIAAQASVTPDETIVSVGGQPVRTREAAVLGILDVLVDDGDVPMTVADAAGHERHVVLAVPAEKRLGLTAPGALLDGLGFAFWYPKLPVVVGQLTEGGPAQAAGLLPGDRIVAVDGKRVDDFMDFVKLVRGRPDATLAMDVVRDGTQRSVQVHVGSVVEDGKTIGRIGLSAGGSASFPASMRTDERYGPLSALRHAALETWSKTDLTAKFLWRMVTGDVSTKNISGPINIAQYAGLSALGGMTYFLGFMALISISLGVLNLLPIPILDGGQVLYQLAEIVKGRPLSEEAQVVGQKVGIAFLVALMGFAFYNDIARLLG